MAGKKNIQRLKNELDKVRSNTDSRQQSNLISGSMEVDFFNLHESLFRREVAHWQQARMVRRDIHNPMTNPLQQLYKDAMLDNHLQGIIESRILRVINKDFVLKDAQGNVDTVRSAYVQTRWFRHVVRKAIESIFYGYSLLFIADVQNGRVKKVVDIPRENVIPERGALLRDGTDVNSDYIFYPDFPSMLVYIKLGDSAVGTLERIAPMTIFKRHSWACWDEFEQIFGIPIRIARTQINTEKHKNELQKWLETMGSASYGIFDKQVDIEVKENSKADSFNVFLQKINAINREMSKGVIGQTMTVDDGSSKSQADVHLQIFDDITRADMLNVKDWATDDFLPVLRNLGYDIPEGYYLDIIENEVIKPLDKIKIDAELLRAGFNLKPEYIREFYATELDEDEPRANLNSYQQDFFGLGSPRS